MVYLKSMYKFINSKILFYKIINMIYSVPETENMKDAITV